MRHPGRLSVLATLTCFCGGELYENAPACGTRWYRRLPHRHPFFSCQQFLDCRLHGLVLLFQFGKLLRLGLNPCILSRDMALLLLHFIQQHRRELLVANAADLPGVIAENEFRIDLGHFLGNQAILQCAVRVVLEVEADGPQLLQLFRVRTRWSDCRLVSLGGGPNGEPSGGIPMDRQGAWLEHGGVDAFSECRFLLAFRADADGAAVRCDALVADDDSVAARDQ